MESETTSEQGAIFEAIVEYSVTQSANASTFGKLLAVGIECMPFGDQLFADRCYSAESAYLLDTLGADEFDKLPKYSSGEKAGQVRTAGLLPKTYQHARSTILNALEAGIALTDDDGMPLGKTALEKRKRDAEKPESSDTAEIGEKLTKLAEKAVKLMKSSDYPQDHYLLFNEKIREFYHA